MSFTYDMRAEAVANVERKKCCQMAEILGITLLGTDFKKGEWRFLSENTDILKHIAVLFKWAFSLKESVVIDGKEIYISRFSDVEAVLEKLFLTGRIGDAEKLLKKPCCKKAFIRGAFLAGGQLADPEREYRAEFLTEDDEICRLLCESLESYELHPKISLRGGKYVIYFKSSEEVSDVLKMVDAQSGVWAIIYAKIQKNKKSNINRALNCEMANMDKVAAAAAKQRVDILKLEKSGRLLRLPEKLQEVARVRLENPEASMTEMGALLGISKSAVSHRLRKISEYAETGE